MEHEEIIAMAREAGIEFQSHVGVLGRTNTTTSGSQSIDKIQRLIELAAAKEREACALVCDAKAHEVRLWCNESNVIACAAAIRARGTKEGV